MLKGFYTVVDKTDTSCRIQFADAEHEIFLAHFPKHPMVPGFALIDTLAEILEDTVVHIKQSKFIAHVLPNDTIDCRIDTKEHKKHIVLTKDNKRVSEFSYETA